MKKTLGGLALGLGLLLTGCSAPGPADHYTGSAVIQDTYKNSRKSGCKLIVAMPDGTTDTVSVGRRTTCNGYSKGQSIQISNGRLVR
ncbi:hypothetical protein [Pseudarthrobacter chlorophenolicus]|uniref:hypothetical protein n=1 Tax=Pseudarthrobacter chlorophenolicus TaxID=85085 RepID=UPI0002F93F1A|nr:hypothetical protein [Pseudarthrobacter chlorophenolicus]SDQ18182.1 hypothetical protein SAMN04489738_0547 [Pseudarthrobacter chlorophenolicus]